MERSEFEEGLQRLCRAFKRALDSEQALIWWEEIGFAQGQAWLTACREAVTHAKFFPSLAEMIERTKENTRNRATIQDTVHPANLPAAQLLLALYSCPGTLDAVDEIVAEWTRDHPEQTDLWEKMGMSYLRG